MNEEVSASIKGIIRDSIGNLLSRSEIDLVGEELALFMNIVSRGDPEEIEDARRAMRGIIAHRLAGKETEIRRTIWRIERNIERIVIAAIGVAIV